MGSSGPRPLLRLVRALGWWEPNAASLLTDDVNCGEFVDHDFEFVQKVFMNELNVG